MIHTFLVPFRTCNYFANFAKSPSAGNLHGIWSNKKLHSSQLSCFPCVCLTSVVIVCQLGGFAAKVFFLDRSYFQSASTNTFFRYCSPTVSTVPHVHEYITYLGNAWKAYCWFCYSYWRVNGGCVMDCSRRENVRYPGGRISLVLELKSFWCVWARLTWTSEPHLLWIPIKSVQRIGRRYFTTAVLGRNTMILHLASSLLICSRINKLPLSFFKRTETEIHFVVLVWRRSLKVVRRKKKSRGWLAYSALLFVSVVTNYSCQTC